MKVSVVIPVYNKKPFLKECFDSVFAQTYADFELIAVDDQSTDGSREWLRALTDPRVRVIELPANLGPSGCAQRGFDAAQGEYIVRMDADDVMFPDRIAKQVAFMDANPGIGASGGHMELYHERGVLRTATLGDKDIRAASLFHIPIYQPTSIYRRDVLNASGLRFEDHWPRYGEDWLFQLRLLRVTQVANMDAPLVRYRVGPQNISHGRDNHADLKVLFRAVLQWYGLPDDPASLHQHLRAIKFFPDGLPPKGVAELKHYLANVERAVLEKQHFDAEAFQLRIRRVWDDLAYQLPRFGWRTALAYVLRDPRPSLSKFRYLSSSLVKGKVYRPSFGQD